MLSVAVMGEAFSLADFWSRFVSRSVKEVLFLAA